jgi:hypothetical protein
LAKAGDRLILSLSVRTYKLCNTHRLLLPGHVEHIAGFVFLRVALVSVYGPLSSQALASVIFGLYAGLVYVTPIAGGLLADARNRVLVATRCCCVQRGAAATGGAPNCAEGLDPCWRVDHSAGARRRIGRVRFTGGFRVLDPPGFGLMDPPCMGYRRSRGLSVLRVLFL